MSTNTESKQQWGSRMGFLLACLGMCIGTGNVWRFPRVCAANGGGSFIIAWTVAMLIFAVPLLINEMVMGKTSRLGNLGAFRDMGGKKTTWMGFFVIMTCLGIASYYSVLNGYCFRYGISSLISHPANLTVAEAEGIWNSFLDNKLVV
ncbi:MAG: sodium-dependent transporter, partial [Clostridia bacterium]|nr:sodium-dependent transporter [Clostridia bacterium]